MKMEKKKKLYGPFLLWMGINCLKATATSRRLFNFYHSVPRNSWCSFYRPRKDERLSRPWSHPVVLIMGPLDWESSALTSRPLLHKKCLVWDHFGFSFSFHQHLRKFKAFYISMKTECYDKS